MAQHSQKFITPLIIFLATFMYLVPENAQAQKTGDAMRGATLANSWCRSCHIIDNRGTGNSIDPATPFPIIANDPKKTTAYLQRWLNTSHPQMPNFDLGRREVMDLAAYIRSLKTVK